jgi:hypothetical protein
MAEQGRNPMPENARCKKCNPFLTAVFPCKFKRNRTPWASCRRPGRYFLKCTSGDGGFLYLTPAAFGIITFHLGKIPGEVIK